LPLLVAIGYVAATRKGARKETLAALAIYFIGPIVFFFGAWQAPLSSSSVALPLLSFLIASVLCLAAYRGLRPWMPRPGLNLLAFASGNVNSGYFGIPAAVALLGEEAFPRAALLSLGFVLYENTVGYFVTARGHHTVGESLRRVARLPSVYAFVAGAALNVAGIAPGQGALDFLTPFRGAYSVFGMILVGMGLADALSANRARAAGSASALRDFRFLGFGLAARFLAWPLALNLAIALDTAFFGFFGPAERQSLRLVGFLPVAANVVAIATDLKTEPEKAAFLVLASTIVSLLLLPLAPLLLFS
jgi:predicted permease